MRFRYIILLLFSAFLTDTSAQVYPVYSQYLMDGIIINPAYAGSRGALSSTFYYRQQWAGLEGSPLFQSFSVHAPLKSDRVAIGLMGQYLTYGVTKTTGIYGHYAYRIRAGNKGKISFGLKAGVDMSNNNLASVYTITPDPVFTGGASSYTLPNVGAGIYYYSDNAFLGASIPAFLSYREASSGSGYEVYNSVQNYDILVFGGGLITFSEAFKFKPSALLKLYMNNTYGADLNANFIFGDVVWLGGSWRIGEEALVGILELQLGQKLKIGYAYDYQMGGLSKFSSGSHEIVMRFEFTNRVSASNPRYF